MFYLFSFWKVQIAGKSRGFRIPDLKWRVRVIACTIWQNTIQARNSRNKQSVPFLTREVVSRQYSSLLLCSSFYNLFVSLTNPTQWYFLRDILLASSITQISFSLVISLMSFEKYRPNNLTRVMTWHHNYQKVKE